MSRTQVNVQLSAELSAVLDALAFLEDRSRSEIAREWVEGELTRRRMDADVADVLAIRSRSRSAKTNVMELKTRQVRRKRVAPSPDDGTTAQ